MAAAGPALLVRTERIGYAEAWRIQRALAHARLDLSLIHI